MWAKAKDDRELFSILKSSDPARLFRYLVEPKGMINLELYLRATFEQVEMLDETFNKTLLEILPSRRMLETGGRIL